MPSQKAPRASRIPRMLLTAVAETPSSSTVEITTATKLSKTTALRQLGRLHEAGMVTKSASPWDRRCTCWVITERGRGFLQQLSVAAE